jgi:hypothetical protein
MRNVPKILVLIIGVTGLAACHKQSQQMAEANQDMSIDDNLTQGQLPANAEIETLPPDESDQTSNGELSKGDDNPDVNDLGNSD